MLHESGSSNAKTESNVDVVNRSFELFCPTIAHMIRHAIQSLVRPAVLCRVAIRDNGAI